MRTFNVDIDGILCEPCDFLNYQNAVPKKQNIEAINNLYQDNFIFLYTSRKKIDKKETEQWLQDNGVKYHGIIYDKPQSDFYVDDLAINNLPYIRPRESPEKLVICVSGGLDSTIAYHIAKKTYKDIICLFFNVGQPYYEKEKNVLKSLEIPFKEIDLSSVYADVEMQGHIIVNRNALFANIGSIYGNRVWIVGLKYENHYLMSDKNDQFYRYVSLSATQSTGKNVIVETPFREWSKTDILNYCIENELLEVVDKTTSCYDKNEHRCGKCSLCVRRFVAGKTAGIDEKFATNPKESQEAKLLVEKYEKALAENDFSHYSKERIIESLNILK